MKTLSNFSRILVISLLFYAGCTTSRSPVYQSDQRPVVTYQHFYDELSPFGVWINYPGYGHVWHPSVAGDFRPYLTNGYWGYTNLGWMWVSNYSWGWAPFHYGRWFFDNMYGWLWVPGYDWSPAWVTWGYVDNYYAWAPIMPGVNIMFGEWRPASFYWNILPRNYMYHQNIHPHVINYHTYNPTMIDRITVINNFGNTENHHYYSKGPDVREVERYVDQRIRQTSINEVSRKPDAAPSRRENEVPVYRPAIEGTQRESPGTRDQRTTTEPPARRSPQPREYRSAEPQRTSPVRREGDRVNENRQEQQSNINQLPVQRGATEGTSRERSTENPRRPNRDN